MIDETAFSDISPVLWEHVGTKSAARMMEFCCLDGGLQNKGRLYLFLNVYSRGFWD